MIQWFAFNFAVLLMSLAIVFNFRNDVTVAVAWVMFAVAVILIIKDFFMVRR